MIQIATNKVLMIVKVVYQIKIVKTMVKKKFSTYKDQSLEFAFIHFIRIMYVYFRKVEISI